jgi:hypothetical protein
LDEVRSQEFAFLIWLEVAWPGVAIQGEPDYLVSSIPAARNAFSIRFIWPFVMPRLEAISDTVAFFRSLDFTSPRVRSIALANTFASWELRPLARRICRRLFRLSRDLA